MPAADRFHVVDEYGPEKADRPDHHARRAPAREEEAFYRAIADDLHARLNLSREDMTIVPSENEPIDWSFGDGEAQYVKA